MTRQQRAKVLFILNALVAGLEMLLLAAFPPETFLLGALRVGAFLVNGGLGVWLYRQWRTTEFATLLTAIMHFANAGESP